MVKEISDAQREYWGELADAMPEYRVLSEGIRLAKKGKLCSQGHKIFPGQYYHYVSMIYEGEFQYEKECQQCRADMQDIIEGRA